MRKSCIVTAEFNLTTYSDMVNALIKRGYTVTGFSKDPLPTSPLPLLLRHDIDVDLTAAVAMAKVEAAAGWRATYFPMVRGECYNLVSAQNARAINQIALLGHAVGV